MIENLFLKTTDRFRSGTI